MTEHQSDALERITQLARLAVEQAAEVERLTEQLTAAKTALTRTRQEDLPELMRELGVTSIKLATGQTVTLNEVVHASIPVPLRWQAFDWLTQHGFGGLIKTELTLEYGRDEREQAIADAAQIREMTRHSPIVAETVHPQTLRAFVREQLEAGKPVPFDLFGVTTFSEAKIK